MGESRTVREMKSVVETSFTSLRPSQSDGGETADQRSPLRLRRQIHDIIPFVILAILLPIAHNRLCVVESPRYELSVKLRCPNCRCRSESSST